MLKASETRNCKRSSASDEVIDLTSDDAQEMPEQPPRKHTKTALQECMANANNGGSAANENRAAANGARAAIDDKQDAYMDLTDPDDQLELALHLSLTLPGARDSLPGSGLGGGASLPCLAAASLPTAADMPAATSVPRSSRATTLASTQASKQAATRDSIPSANQAKKPDVAAAGIAAAPSVPSSWSGAGACRVLLAKNSQEFKSVFEAFHRKCEKEKYEILSIEVCAFPLSFAPETDRPPRRGTIATVDSPAWWLAFALLEVDTSPVTKNEPGGSTAYGFWHVHAKSHLTQCISKIVLESPLPHKIVKSIF